MFAIPLAAFLSSATVAGQMQASAAALQAAYLFNFARFVEWPQNALPADVPFTMCVTDRSVASALREVVNGRSVETRAIVVRDVALSADVRACQILYVAGIGEPAIQDLVTRVGDTHILTVGDTAEFTSLGGVAHFFLENARMRVAINRAAAERAGLRVSSRLLAVAKLVP